MISRAKQPQSDQPGRVFISKRYHYQELADAVVRIVSDANLPKQMGAAGRTRVEQHFDIRRMVGEYEALYAENRPTGCRIDQQAAMEVGLPQ